jgi:hypothetical protein
MNAPHLLASHLRMLKLPTMLAQWEEVSRQCTDSDLSYGEFLERFGKKGSIPKVLGG